MPAATAPPSLRAALVLLAFALAPASLLDATSRLAAPRTAFAPPAPFVLSLTGGGALVVNLGCALLLARHREHAGSLSKAAWLSARNDAFANLAIIAAGLLTAATLSIWPDLQVGVGITAMNADAAREVWTAARREHLAAKA